jgi:exonuclease SbcC|tara:strand:- start:224 stop:2269 length:2046 start_codon:yes stop_codon:yes gene_type:complete
MKLKKIILNNIRSYENQEIVFPEGSILLSGDIGSGKTSVLLGIEFALFGLQPGQKGSSLLRNGKDSGSVFMEFEVDGSIIEIERSLKKGKTISQNACSITIDGTKKVISVMELKSIIIDLLNYPKEFSKKQNLLYKFTVYTPQEEMKQIIQQDSMTRINTLRHIFGINKYKKIIENTSLLTLRIREQIRIKEAITSNVEQEKEVLLFKKKELETKQQNLVLNEKEFFLKSEERKKIQEEKEEISKKIDEKIKIQQEIEKLKIMISNKKESLENNLVMINQLNKQIIESQEIKFDESEIQKVQDEILIKQKNKEEANENFMKLSLQINSFISKNQENENTKNKIKHIETCPTCIQKVDDIYKENIFRKLDLEISNNLSEIEIMERKKEIFLEESTKFENESSDLKKKLLELNEIKIKFQGIKEKQIRIEEIKKINLIFDKDVNDFNSQIMNFENSLVGLNEFDEIFEKIKQNFDNVFNQERIAEIKVAELRREIQVFSSQMEDLKEKVSRIEKMREEINYLSKLENWLSQKFVPLISFVEKNVMIKLKSEFSELFVDWFSILVSDSLNVKLDDEFTPIIENQDYEIDYQYLSGGERTAVALAYRLALNQIINSLLSKLKTRDLVILDEPTDGFSEQQLDRIRDVLNQLNVKQLIIVSHEQKIEGFVENVIRLKKEKGISGID